MDGQSKCDIFHIRPSGILDSRERSPFLWLHLHLHNSHIAFSPFTSGARQIAKTAEKLAREKELAKVAIRKEDVDLIADEMEIRDESIVHRTFLRLVIIPP